jgi:hypothetical protein
MTTKPGHGLIGPWRHADIATELRSAGQPKGRLSLRLWKKPTSDPGDRVRNQFGVPPPGDKNQE